MTSLTRELAGLVEDLRCADPSVRDDRAYSRLAELAGAGALDDHLPGLADSGLELLADGEVQARSFGALLLALVVDRDNRTGRAGEPVLRRALVAVTGWYVEERDTRGWDPALGWLHAVAHGADLVGALAESPRLGRADLRKLLDLLVDRATTPTALHWLQNEDDRVAVAMMAVLRRDLLDGNDVRAVVDRLAAAWRTAGSGSIGAQTDNAVRLGRTWHLQLTLGVRPDPDAPVGHPRVRGEALRALGDALADIHWFYGRPA